MINYDKNKAYFSNITSIGNFYLDFLYSEI